MRGWIDPFSSGAWFDGWSAATVRERALEEARRTVAELGGDAWPPRPEGWLLTVGWRRRGLIDVDEVPSSPTA